MKQSDVVHDGDDVLNVEAFLSLSLSFLCRCFCLSLAHSLLIIEAFAVVNGEGYVAANVAGTKSSF